MKHTIKIIRNCFSRKSQHNPGSTLVSSAPNLWAVDLWKVVRVYARACRRAAIFKPSSHLHVDTRMCANVVVLGLIVNGDYTPATSAA
jgi:hypothetical protein